MPDDDERYCVTCRVKHEEIERLLAELAELRRTGCRSEKQRRIDAVYEDEYRVGDDSREAAGGGE